MADDLDDWGKVVILETRGRHTGRRRRAAVGYVGDADGSLVVAAADEQVHWALNLMAEPRCVVERHGARVEHRATVLDDAAHHAAVAALIVKYGTPAERLGAGPAFRLTPTGLPPDADRPSA
jgi:deazaflavin-dependent oxidoreductase (nitroreductase family)